MALVAWFWRRVGLHPSTGDFLVSLLLGVLVWAWVSQFVLAWGGGYEATTALALAFGAAVAAASRPSPRRPATAATWRWLGPAAWAVIAPELLTRSVDACGGAFGESLAKPAVVFLAALMTALVAVAPGVFLNLELIRTARSRSVASSAFWLGLGGAWLVAPSTVGLWPGVQTTSLAMALLCVGMFVFRTWRPLAPAAATATPAGSVEIVARGMSLEHGTLVAALSAAAGIGMVLVERLQGRLLLPAASLSFALWGGAALGVAMGLKPRNHDRDSRRRSASTALLVLGLALVAEAALFPLWSRFALWVSTSVASLTAIMGLRALFSAALAAPVGWVAGRMIRSEGSGTESSGRLTANLTPSLTALWFTAGYVAASWSTWGPGETPIVAAVLILAAGALRIGSRTSATSPRLARLAWPAAAAAAVVCGVLVSDSAMVQTSRTLFSGLHFQNWTSGIPARLLPHVDDARCLSSTETPDTTWSVWSARGCEWRLHSNGVFQSAVSLDPEVCPQAAADVLTAVLPLVLHSQPDNVLVLSSTNPSVLATCLAFPVPAITAVERDAGVIAFAKQAVERVWPQIATGDDRLEWKSIDPLLAPIALSQTFDIIIAPQAPIVDFGRSGLASAEYYRRVAGRLREGGLFCQRFSCFDVSSSAAVGLARTLRSVFPAVSAIEVAQGEWLFIGRFTDEPIDDQVVKRLERDHARRVLANSGWDWSIVMGLRTISPKVLATLTEGGRPNSIASAEFAYVWPADVMRWAPKFEDRRQWMAAHSQPLAEGLGESSAVTEISQRLSDVQLAQQILSDHPDQFWAYRQWLKKRLQDRPRAMVIQTEADGLRNGLHPEDENRKDYLRALGRVMNDGVSRANLDVLASYAAPFDPLVSPFLPRELATLEERSPQADHRQVYRSWLHSVHFAPPTDASVRNVCHAVDAVVDHPDVVANAGERWDQLNALLEVLEQRWALRMSSATQMTYGPADAEACLQAADRILTTLEAIHGAVGVSDEAWQARRTIVERQLVRPLRSWRSQQSARFAVAERPAPPPVDVEPDGVQQADGQRIEPETQPPATLTPQQTAGQPLHPQTP